MGSHIRYRKWSSTLILLALSQWSLPIEASLIGSKNITFDATKNTPPIEHEELPDLYRPYDDSASFARFQSRSRQPRNNHRQVNTNPDNVVSCGSCCFEVLPVRGSTFVTAQSRHREALRKNRFYVKLVDVAGIPLVASYDVRDSALLETALLLVKMASKNPHLLDYLRDEAIHFAVIGKDEKLTDLPSYDQLDPVAWDYARGVGATRWRPVSSCAEEDVLCLSDATYANENICVHEHSHTLAGSGGKLPTPRMIDFNGIQQNLNHVLREVYDDRITDIDSAGRPSFLWENTYAGTNHEEMWAEGVQSYFNVNREGPSGGDGIHNHVWSRPLLEAYHVELHDVIQAVFPSNVNLGCPGTSMNDCDCTQIRQLCQQVGVTIPSNPVSTRPPTRPPTRHPTQRPTPQPTLSTPFPTPKPSPSPSRSWPSSSPTEAPSVDRTPGSALGVSTGTRNAPRWKGTMVLASLVLTILLY